MGGVVFTLGLVAVFVVALRIFWLRAEPPMTTGLPPEDGPPQQAPARMPWGERRQRRYIERGLRDLEAWARQNARRPDAGT